MLPRKLQELWDGMERNRRITLGMVSGISAPDFVTPDEGEWSIAEILEYLVLAETRTNKRIRKLMKKNAGKLPPYPADDSVLTVRETAGPANR